jgi:beta-glucanase (GH16 family)
MSRSMRFIRVCALLLCICAPLFQHTAPPPAVAARARTADAPPAGVWRMVFNDEFDGATLKTALWGTCDFIQIGDGCTGGAPGALSWHQPDDVLITNGLLRLRAQQRTVFDAQGGRHDVTSGLVTTKERFNFRYGYLEARVKMPRGRGMWPAFFTTPVRRRAHVPEIDIFELLGTDSTRVFMTYHFPDAAPPDHQIQSTFSDPADFANDFHTFGALWEPGLIVYYIDGVERWRVTDRVTDEHAQVALFLNVGVNWEDNNYLDETSIFPSFFDVDYVRVWQRGTAPSGVIVDDAADYDNAFAISHELQHLTGNDALFEGDMTRWSPSTNLNPTFVVWDVNNARTFEANTFFWPRTNVRPYRFFASGDLINYTELTPDAQPSQPGWTKVLYRVNLPAGTRLVKVQFPQMDEVWHSALGRITFSPEAVSPPTATPDAAPTVTPVAPPTSTPVPGGIPVRIRTQNSSGMPFASLRTTALNLNSSVLLTENTNAQGDVLLTVAPGNYKICQDIPANHRPLFGAVDSGNRACIWISLANDSSPNLLFAYEAAVVDAPFRLWVPVVGQIQKGS